MPAFLAFATPMDGNAPVISAQPSASQLVADGSESTISASANQIARVTATSNVYIAFGEAGTVNAGEEPRHYVASGQTLDFGRIAPGWVMDVTAA